MSPDAASAGVLDDPAAPVLETKAAAPRRIAVVGSYTIVTFRGWLIEDMVAQGHTVFACAPELSATDLARLARAGAVYQRIGLARTGIDPFQDIAHVTRLAALFRKLEIEVVLAHTTKAMIVGCLAARLAGVPRIFAIVEGLGYAFTEGPERKRRLVRAILAPAMKAALAVCDGVFVLNSDDRAYLIGLGILSPKQKVVQIAGTGLDLDHYAYVPPTPGPPRFLLIARLIRDKGIVEYVEAARIVKAKHPEARFRLLGSIDEHPGAITRAQIAAWEAEGVVEYLGVTDDVRPYLADCTCYVLPSYREGMPRTIMEAMAVGRPVIATDVPGCRDAIEHGVTGWLVPPRDVGALAEACMEPIVEPRMIEEFSAGARQAAARRFSTAGVNRDIIRSLSPVAPAPAGVVGVALCRP
jgi:glycosyltransferase involved in cell wall biosynthesis